jgi:hypothetical protein
MKGETLLPIDGDPRHLGSRKQDCLLRRLEGDMRQDSSVRAVAQSVTACDKGPLISERPQGFVGLVAQLPIAHRADRSTIILSILDAKHHAKAQYRHDAPPAIARRRAMIGDRARLASSAFAAAKTLRMCRCRSGFR